MAELSGESPGGTNALRVDARDPIFHSKHMIFLSHSGAQKDFVEQLCVDLERCDRYPFFDKRSDSLPIGENFPQHIFDAIEQCHIGVVILSEEFFTRSKWPMMELVAMVKEAKKRKPSFKILPIFLCISLDQFRDSTKQDQWLSCWQKLALKDKRLHVEEWEEALKYLQPLNSMVYDGMGEVKFRKAIVDEICKVVLPERRLEDSHIQGKSRLCKVIQEKINAHQNEKNYDVCVVGLYGMGGIGKTSICKALCNEFVTKFQHRVCHVELEKTSKEELMREVLNRLTNMSYEHLQGWNKDELLKGLNGGMIKEAVFLAIDNILDTQASIDEATSYLGASLPRGSIVMVTSRTKDTLMRIRPYVVESACLEMPELDMEEAKSLFCKSSNSEMGRQVDEELITRCVKRCYFRKDDGSESYHYHPLTLDVLGKQLGCMDPKDWKAQLDKLDEDIFNQSKETKHPIFSILRKSFDTISLEDQLLLMDVAFFLPLQLNYKISYYSHVEKVAYELDKFEWLGMVHRISVDDVMRGLERLKRKSLLERVGDGIETRIGMHDLWRAFCLAEVQSGELRCRRWVYAKAGSGSELVETSPSGSCWENVKRMAFVDFELRSLESVNFAHFSNVTVLKILDIYPAKELVLNLSRLPHLKSLELTGRELHKLVLQGLPRCLIFLRLSSYYEISRCSQKLVKEVECLTDLQHLELFGYSGDKLPDMRRMVSLRVAIFHNCENVVTLAGLSTKLHNLRVLHLGNCSRLQSCLGVGDLVALEELNFTGCRRIKKLPNVGKLRNLRKLDLSGCPLITEVSGLGELVSLEELYAGPNSWRDPASYSLMLPDMSKLSKLRILRLHECRLEVVSGFESLVSLQEVEADFRKVVISLREVEADFLKVVDMPSLRQLTKLQTLEIRGWSLEGLRGLDNLAMLRYLEVHDCRGVDNLPDFQGLISLQRLAIWNCEFKDVSGLSNLIALEHLEIRYCGMLERLPDFQRLSTLEQLTIWYCGMLRRLKCTVGQVEGTSWRPDSTCVGPDLPDSQTLTNLRALYLRGCKSLEDVTVIGAFSHLETLWCDSLAVSELPSLSNFPRLKRLRLAYCNSLRRLTIREPIHALSKLVVEGCSSLTTLPNLSNFPGLGELELWKCEGISGLSCSGPLTALQQLKVVYAGDVKELPDVGMFPALEKLFLEGCSGLTTLSSSVSLPTLKVLDARGCNSLSRDDVDKLQALCPECEIKYGALDVDVEESDATVNSRVSRIIGCFRS